MLVKTMFHVSCVWYSAYGDTNGSKLADMLTSILTINSNLFIFEVTNKTFSVSQNHLVSK